MSSEHESRDIVSLPLPERLCIWSVRVWAEHADDLSTVWASLETAFTQGDIPTALDPLHRFLAALDHHAVRFPEIRSGHAALSNDELCLLASICLAQRGRPEAVRSLLKKWAPIAATPQLLEHLMEYAGIEQRAGHHFALPRAVDHTHERRLPARSPIACSHNHPAARPLLRLAARDGKRLI